jgi:hypothetical protein
MEDIEAYSDYSSDEDVNLNPNGKSSDEIS